MKEESVLCFSKSTLPYNFNKKYLTIKRNISDFKNDIRSIQGIWLPRKQAEKNLKYKQVIPYIIVTDNTSSCFSYKRDGVEKRLHGLWSIGLGGHINVDDSCKGNSDLWNVIVKGAERELFEEIGINNNLAFLGIINEELTMVGNVHLGLVFKTVVTNFHKLKISQEVADYKIINFSDITKIKLELWSKLALELLNNV